MVSTLAERLLEARTAAGFGQDYVATRAGMSQQSYSDLETGRSKSTSKIGSLAYILGVHALWLETGDGPKEPGGVAEDPAFYLSEDRRRALELFDSLTDRRRQALFDLLQDGEEPD